MTLDSADPFRTPESTLTEEVTVAVGAARAAATALLSHFRTPQPVTLKRGRRDLVTIADIDAEAAALEYLGLYAPNDAVLSEERGAMGTGTRIWILDPLDGTTNFACGNPYWAVSVALQEAGVTKVGVILDPLRDEMFVATSRSGVTLNGVALAPISELPFAHCVISLNLSPERLLRSRKLRRVLLTARDIRRAGSIALDLAWVAAQRIDACAYRRRENPWDWAAGELIAASVGATRTLLNAGSLELTLVGRPDPREHK